MRKAHPVQYKYQYRPWVNWNKSVQSCPNSAMDSIHNPDPRADSRLTELEIKASFAEDMLESLNQVIVRQQEQIDNLLRETRQLRALLPDGLPGMAAGRPADELPPHY